MDDGASPKKRHSFSGKLWKQLKPSKNKQKAKSFVSYSNESDDESGVQRQSYISHPTNFEHREIDRIYISLEHISIQECPFDVTGYGNLIMKDKFKLRRPKKKKLVVFLFEKIIIFTTAKKDQDLYYYYGCIKISNLSVDPPGHKDTKIILKDFVNSRLSKHLIEYKLEAASDKIQNSWRDALHKCLWLELVNAKSR